MDTLIENLPQLLRGFGVTLQLAVISALAALVLGTVLAAFRVSPIPPLRWFGTAYVEAVRNTPLTIVFFFMVFVAPRLGLLLEFRISAIVALSLYTAAFVCEAVRSGINSVSTGQAEAARALGMTFQVSMSQIVLPQAMRSIVPPLTNVFVALTKNTSVASGFLIVELFRVGRTLAIRNPTDAMWMLGGVAVLYLCVTVPAGVGASRLEKRVAIAR